MSGAALRTAQWGVTMKYIAAALSLMLAQPVGAQIMREGTTPTPGVEQSATVGSTIIEAFRYAALPAFEISERVQAQILFARVDIPAGAKLVPINTQTRLKACYVQTLQDVASENYAGCLMDDDGDGTFDRVAGNNVQGGRRLPHPVPYTQSELILHSSERNFRQHIIYLGVSGDTLRLSYREFMNDMARPAFTEEYSLPLSPDYPQTLAVKDFTITIISVGPSGLRYRIEEIPQRN